MRYLFLYTLLFITLLLLSCGSVEEKNRIVDNRKLADRNSEIDYLKGKIKEYPKNLINYFKIVDMYREEGLYQNALTTLEMARKHDAENPELLGRLVEVYMDLGEMQKASQFLSEIAPKEKSSKMDFRIFARYYLETGDEDLAIDYANKALNANPYDWESHKIKGDAYLDQKDTVLAIISYQSAYSIYDGRPVFQRLFGALLENHKVNEAGNLLRDYKSTHPTDEKICYEEGQYALALADLDAAKEIFSTCLSAYSKDPFLYLQMGKLYLNVYKYDSALMMIDKSLSLNNNEEALLLKAEIFNRKQQFSEAMEIYTSIIKMDSTSLIARRELEKLERKVAYLQALRRKEALEKSSDSLQPLKSKEIN